MTGQRHWSGLSAEDIAARHYEASGATVLHQRFRTPHGEVDLIVRDGSTLVFVEVKARRDHASAAHAITPRQWQRVAAAAQVYMSEEGLSADTDMRFDAALVDRQGRLEIVPNAAEF